MQQNSFNGGWPSSSSSSFSAPVEELHAEQEVSEEQLPPQQETGGTNGTGECQLTCWTFVYVGAHLSWLDWVLSVEWPGWVWSRSDEKMFAVILF